VTKDNTVYYIRGNQVAKRFGIGKARMLVECAGCGSLVRKGEPITWDNWAKKQTGKSEAYCGEDCPNMTEFHTEPTAPLATELSKIDFFEGMKGLENRIAVLERHLISATSDPKQATQVNDELSSYVADALVELGKAFTELSKENERQHPNTLQHYGSLFTSMAEKHTTRKDPSTYKGK
jgi:hypothetical protein